MLVFASDLEEVEEISCGCVDGDQVLVWIGNWVGERGNGEIVWTLGLLVIVKEREWEKVYLDIFFDLNSTHFERIGRYLGSEHRK
jgi:hypothetical protein